MKRTLFLILLFAAGVSTSTFSAEFITKIVDGLGRPIPDVAVKVLWYREVSEDSVDTIDSLVLRSDSGGIVRGKYRKKTDVANEFLVIEFSKDGYGEYNQGFNFNQVEREYVIRKIITAKDVHRVAKLKGEAQRIELRELLRSEFKSDNDTIVNFGNGLTELIFFYERQFSPALRSLIEDDKVGPLAGDLLAVISNPEDLSMLVQRGRQSYLIVSSLLDPNSNEEWAFLRKCALNNEDFRIAGRAINSLKLIPSKHSLEILQDTYKWNRHMRELVNEAIQYLKSNPQPLTDTSLVELEKKVAKAIQMSGWTGNGIPRFNAEENKALIDFDFIVDCNFAEILDMVDAESSVKLRDLYVYTATFHKVNGVWKLRSLRETMRASLGAADTSKTE